MMGSGHGCRKCMVHERWHVCVGPTPWEVVVCLADCSAVRCSAVQCSAVRCIEAQCHASELRAVVGTALQRWAAVTRCPEHLKNHNGC